LAPGAIIVDGSGIAIGAFRLPATGFVEFPVLWVVVGGADEVD